MAITRRDLCSLMPALAFLPSSLPAEATPDALRSTAFPFAQLTPRTSGAATIRNIVKGKAPTGEQVEVHETVLAPGGTPHPPHHHVHSEFWLIREGQVEITIAGTPHQLGPGSAAFAASNDEHSIKNIGSQPASYFVVAVGPMNS